MNIQKNYLQIKNWVGNARHINSAKRILETIQLSTFKNQYKNIITANLSLILKITSYKSILQINIFAPL